jgi:3-hydroxymyristoyl/3-hydroxydecanoyl-(acyl carrier protein) dehydratase
VTGVDVDGGRIAGVRRLDPDDPVFAGHFPGTPVYPGSLQLEMAGQLALCLHRLSARGCGTGPSRPTLVTGVLRAAFLRTLAPGDTATVLARRLEEDDLVGTALVQTLRDEEVCSAAVLQVCFP